ncbi:Zinc finger A20 and AN1 domain-containing stress-associated protein 4 [Platanthera zijinensis]|uniref:Zinc finger A20 and AN1 domain-containing stress-associated protein 4 n=1 Tax=Platanthera zijinensis TaxID=2320716 RepID=A0AAP0AZW6_9ASPA
MEEEQRCQEGHLLCANNCGFFGSPATMNFCSKCYRDISLKEEQASSAKMAVEKSLLPSSSAPFLLPSSIPEPFATTIETPLAPAEDSSPSPPARPQAGRCTACRKKLGLTGFRCRCGMAFCGNHHHPEKHGCSFDYKTAGREAIKRANPVVKAAKLDKI